MYGFEKKSCQVPTAWSWYRTLAAIQFISIWLSLVSSISVKFVFVAHMWWVACSHCGQADSCQIQLWQWGCLNLMNSARVHVEISCVLSCSSSLLSWCLLGSFSSVWHCQHDFACLSVSNKYLDGPCATRGFTVAYLWNLDEANARQQLAMRIGLSDLTDTRAGRENLVSNCQWSKSNLSRRMVEDLKGNSCVIFNSMANGLSVVSSVGGFVCKCW